MKSGSAPAPDTPATLLRLLGLGLLAALFFSSTFVLNRAMSLQGGHWVWSAALRYLYTLLLIALGFLTSGRAMMLGRVGREFARNWRYWVVAGGLGFGVFYTGVTMASVWAPGWVVATTWQLTILATPLVLLAFGRRVPLRGVFFALLIFVGILLVNLEQMRAGMANLRGLALGILPVAAAALAYPTGMQMVWEARAHAERSSEGPRRRRYPEVDTGVLDQPFARVLLLVIGSAPWWMGLWVVVRPPPPTPSQWITTGIVALLSGIVATVLFMQARHMATSAYQLAAVDSTQATEVLFSLIAEVAFLGALWPGRLGQLGVALTVGGLVLYLAAQGGGQSRRPAVQRPPRALRAPRGMVDLRWYQLT